MRIFLALSATDSLTRGRDIALLVIGSIGITRADARLHAVGTAVVAGADDGGCLRSFSKCRSFCFLKRAALSFIL
jgi:hypothetical protein